MSVDAHAEPSARWTATDTIAGLLATVSIFTSAVGLAYRPVRLIPFAILLAFVAARMSARQQRLAGFAVAAARDLLDARDDDRGHHRRIPC